MMKILLNSSIFVLLLMATLSLPEVESFDFGDLGKNVLQTACTTIVGTISTGPCYTEYTAKVFPLLSIKETSPTDVKIRGGLSYCCAVAALRACILNFIQDSCGEDAEFQSSKLIDELFYMKAGVARSKDTCTGDEIIYAKESPLCWSESAQYVAIFVGIFLLMSCCCCCLARICRNRGK